VGSDVGVVAVAELADRGEFDREALVTRPIGEQFRHDLDGAIEAAPGGAVILDFDGVGLIDGSFADEALAPLALVRKRPRGDRRPLALRGLNAASRDNLSMALLTRTVIEKGIRNATLPLLDCDGRAELVGKAESHVRDTFDLLQQRRELTARIVADALGLDIAAASTRLKTIYDLGLAARVELRDAQGRLFAYRWPW
jgi:DNA-binding transcriptional ArsR family regulator